MSMVLDLAVFALFKSAIKSLSSSSERFSAPSGKPLDLTLSLGWDGLTIRMVTASHSDVALLTDGRFSGGSHGFIVGHITPEAQEGGPLALVQDNDIVTIDANTNRLDVNVSESEMAVRKAKWRAPALKATRGTLYKYIKNVKSASEGCVTDE